MKVLIFVYLIPIAFWAVKNLWMVYRAIIDNQMEALKENLVKSFLVIISGAAICVMGYLFKIDSEDAFLYQANCLWGSGILLTGTYSLVVALRATIF